MTETILHSTVFYGLALTLLHFLWQGLLIAFVLKLLLLSIAQTKPQLRYGLSTLAMLLSLLLPLFTFFIIYPQEGSLLNSTINQEIYINKLNQQISFFSYKNLIKDFPLTISSALPYLSFLWLISVITLSIKLLIEIYNVNRLPKDRCLQPKPELLVRFNILVKKIGLTKAPLLLISLKTEVPMAIGWLKPIVLLPASMLTGLNSAQLEMLILHELAHIRRHDYLINFLQTLIEILLFFHPAVAWMSKQMRNEREYCSDDIAVHHCGDPIAYAHTLTDTAALLYENQHPQTIPLMAMTASGGDLKQRVVRLVNHHCSSNNNISKWFAASSIILTIALVSSQQLLTQPVLDLWKTQASWQKKSALPFDLKPNNNLISNDMASFSEGSIAQQLLLKENNHKTINTNALEEVPANKQQTKVNNKSIITFEQIKSLKDSVAQNKIKHSANIQIKHIENRETEEITKQQTQSTISKRAIEHANNLIPTEISTAELAFERTDSTSPLSSEKNPYAEQISLLSNEKIIKSSIDLTSDFYPKTNDFPNTALLNIVKPLPLDAIESKKNSLPVLLAAKQLTLVNPVYPNMAKRKGIEIEVKVNFTIDINGRIKNIQFTSQNKINYFKSSILTAIKKWRFSPAKKDDKPIESQMSKIFSFSLQNT